MKSFEKKLAFTMVELLVAVAILAILASIMMMIGGKGDASAKTELTKSVMVLLDSALQEYHDYTGEFPLQPEINTNIDNVVLHSELLYRELSLYPVSQKILERIPQDLIRNEKGVAGENFLEIYDGWKMPLDYIYAPGKNFPLIISAGLDRKFYNPGDPSNDDITNKK